MFSVDFTLENVFMYASIAVVLLVVKYIFYVTAPVSPRIYPHQGRKKVLIIGCGVSGVVSAKSLLEEGHDIEMYDKAPVFGGVWKFPEERKNEISGYGRDREEGASGQVWQDLITTSSAAISSFSDFFVKSECVKDRDSPFHMTCSQYYEYLSEYIRLNKIEPYMNLGWVVSNMRKTSDNKWKVTLSQGEGWNDATESFDKITTEKECVYDFVVISSGQHQHVNFPQFPGLDGFKGEIVHNSNYINAKPFANKSVLVIGGGDSAADIVKQISDVSKPGQTYASLRHGAHVAPRYFHKDTYPLDYAMFRWSFYLPHFLRVQLRDTAFRKHLENTAMEDKTGKVKSIINIMDMNGLSEEEYFTTKSEQFCEALASNKAILKPEVKMFSSHGATFHQVTKGGADPSEVDIDAVVICTGFTTAFPFLEEKYQRHAHRDRYKLVFHPELDNVAFIGFVRPSGLGSIPPLAEMQARWMAAVVSGKVRLPDKMAMKKEARASQIRFHKQRCFKNEMLVTYAYYLHDIARQLGVTPHMFKLLLTDPSLWWACMMKPLTSQQLRLHGIGAKYDLARDIIMNRVSMPKPNMPSDSTPIIRPNTFTIAGMTLFFGVLSQIPVIGKPFRQCV